jgi:hypothetical protein
MGTENMVAVLPTGTPTQWPSPVLLKRNLEIPSRLIGEDMC